MFNFDKTFEIHDDVEVLKQMGMAYGLENGRCSSDDLKTAQSMLPTDLQPYLKRKFNLKFLVELCFVP